MPASSLAFAPAPYARHECRRPERPAACASPRVSHVIESCGDGVARAMGHMPAIKAHSHGRRAPLHIRHGSGAVVAAGESQVLVACDSA